MFLNDIFNLNTNDKNNDSNEDDDNEDFYKILGCAPTATKEQILAEYRTRALQLHPDKCPKMESKQCEKEFCKLSMAKDVLIDPIQRKNYDVWKNSGLKIPYNKWCSLSKQSHTSIHWMNSKPNQRKAITETDSKLNDNVNDNDFNKSHLSSSSSTSPMMFRLGESKTNSNFDEDNSKILKMFRNYQI